ncbi:hypothetical protein [Undibacterium pigrum]|uniref:hypothetical protein n=1 Tax=Undibacterium pigrum TaxID=401470 RepID=UPI000D75DC7B|nr:hypothetical protein [Undibacterium pigrum]
MKPWLKTALAILLLSGIAGVAIAQNWITGSAGSYFVVFVSFFVFAAWLIVKVLSTVSRHNENLVACPKCKMRTDSLRDECMWCDEGL